MKKIISLVALLMSVVAVCARTPFSQQLLEKAKAGKASAQFEVGLAYIDGNGVAKNLPEGKQWVEKSAAQNYTEAQVLLGDIYCYGINDQVKACEWWQKASDGGDAYASYNLSIMYKNGWGVPQNINKSFSLLKKAAESGYLDAMFNLANYYTRGDGVTVDNQKAVFWYKKAAEKGHAGAYYNLALRYINGDGVSKDIAAGKNYLRKAAEGDYLFALLTLGEACYEGSELAGAVDYNKAFNYISKFIELAADYEIDNSMYGTAYRILSKCYRFGRGVKADEAMADKYLRKANAYGDESAISAARSLGFNI